MRHSIGPIPRNEFAIRDVQLSRGAKRCESPAAVARQICSLFSQCLDLDQANCYLLALFVLSTWFIDLLPVAPYIAFVGLSGTGKSTALRLLRLLCRRALLTANIRTSFYRVCRRLTPTLLVDETDTAGDKRVLGLLRMGTTRDIVALRPQESFTAFGAKAFCWTELPHDAGLNRRCLIIPLHETHRNDFKKPSSPEIIEAAEELQQQLLWLRFKKYKSFSALPKIQGDDELYSHSRDLYEALALATGGDKNICEWLVGMVKVQQESNREPLSPEQSAVLRFLFCAIHCSPGVVTVRDLTNGVNSLLRGERGRLLKPREVGSVLSSLGFTRRKRTNRGFMLRLDQKARVKIHELITSYGVDSCAYSSKEAIDQCDLCKPSEGPEFATLYLDSTGTIIDRSPDGR
jgi:hypothetical protein